MLLFFCRPLTIKITFSNSLDLHGMRVRYGLLFGDNLIFSISLFCPLVTSLHDLCNVWISVNNWRLTCSQDKQKTKVKEKLDKCVKDSLLDFCDLFDIPILKAKSNARKVCWFKLFLHFSCIFQTLSLAASVDFFPPSVPYINKWDMLAGGTSCNAAGFYGGTSCYNWCDTFWQRSGLSLVFEIFFYDNIECFVIWLIIFSCLQL